MPDVPERVYRSQETVTVKASNLPDKNTQMSFAFGPCEVKFKPLVWKKIVYGYGEVWGNTQYNALTALGKLVVIVTEDDNCFRCSYNCIGQYGSHVGVLSKEGRTLDQMVVETKKEAEEALFKCIRTFIEE